MNDMTFQSLPVPVEQDAAQLFAAAPQAALRPEATHTT